METSAKLLFCFVFTVKLCALDVAYKQPPLDTAFRRAIEQFFLLCQWNTNSDKLQMEKLNYKYRYIFELFKIEVWAALTMKIE